MAGAATSPETEPVPINSPAARAPSRNWMRRPDYFMKQEVQSRQMNFQELQAYIAELEQSGFNTKSLQVDLQGKFSKPLFALILAMVSIPFAFLAGNRGAMTGLRHQLVYLYCVPGNRESVPAGGQPGAVIAGHGRLVARRHLCAFRAVLPGEDAHLTGQFVEIQPSTIFMIRFPHAALASECVT